MNTLGKRILVFFMIWVLLVMALTQLYDNVTGRGMPAAVPTPAAEATVAPDEGVTRLAELQTCVAADPKNLQCTLDLADLYYGAGQWPQAQVNYESVVKLNPHDPAVLLKLAGTYIYQNNFEPATATLQEAVSLRPDAPEVHLLLGLALSKSNPPKMDQAVAEWQQVIKLAPTSAWATQAQQYLRDAGR